MKRIRNVVGVFIFAAFLLGCASPVEIVVARYENIEPGPEWAAWFEDVRECAAPDYPLAFERVNWYEADVIHYVPEDREHFRSVSGLWIEPVDVIFKTGVIGSDAEQVVVRHEMIHVLTQSHDHGHPGFQCTMP